MSVSTATAPAATTSTAGPAVPPAPRTAAPAWAPHPDQVHRYTRTDPHLLAAALHRMTGWPLAALVDGAIDETGTPITDPARLDQAVSLAWLHVGVVDDDGAFWDIFGPAPARAALAEWAPFTNPRSSLDGDLTIVGLDCESASTLLAVDLERSAEPVTRARADAAHDTARELLTRFDPGQVPGCLDCAMR